MSPAQCRQHASSEARSRISYRECRRAACRHDAPRDSAEAAQKSAVARRAGMRADLMPTGHYFMVPRPKTPKITCRSGTAAGVRLARMRAVRQPRRRETAASSCRPAGHEPRGKGRFSGSSAARQEAAATHRDGARLSSRVAPSGVITNARSSSPPTIEVLLRR